jgi:excinuclease ABC subunit B
MGPHASLPIPAGDAPLPSKPVRTIDVPTEPEKKGRRGRPRKTGRPGH